MGFWNKKKKGSVNVSVKAVEPMRGVQSHNSTYSLLESEKKDLVRR
jgi:hypothetical protein